MIRRKSSGLSTKASPIRSAASTASACRTACCAATAWRRPGTVTRPRPGECDDAAYIDRTDHPPASKALAALGLVEPPPAGKNLPELMYSIFFATDHTTHFYALGAPDFIVGPDAPVAERNILGVIQQGGMDVAGKALKMRHEGHY